MNRYSSIQNNKKNEGYHFLNEYQTPHITQNLDELNISESRVEVLKALSDSTKLKIVLLLDKSGSASVSDISKVLDMEHSTVSHALKDLKLLNIVNCERCGRLMCYQMNSGNNLKPLITEIENLLKP